MKEATRLWSGSASQVICRLQQSLRVTTWGTRVQESQPGTGFPSGRGDGLKPEEERRKEYASPPQGEGVIS